MLAIGVLLIIGIPFLMIVLGSRYLPDTVVGNLCGDIEFSIGKYLMHG